MPDQGITVTPSLVTNADGSESVSYEHAQVVSTDGRQRAIANFNAEQENYIREDSQGNRSHQFDLGEQFDELTYQPETPHSFGVPITEQDVSYLQDVVGGPEAFNDLTNWASKNLPKSVKDTFDSVMNTSDVEEMEKAVRALSDFYHENAGQPLQKEQPQQRRAPVEEEFFPTDEQVDEVERFSQLMFDKIGGEENYHTLMGWAQNNLTSTSIDIFDQIMEGDDFRAKAQAIDMLIKTFRDQGDD